MEDPMGTLVREILGASAAARQGRKDGTLEPVQDADLRRMAEAFGQQPGMEHPARQRPMRSAP